MHSVNLVSFFGLETIYLQEGLVYLFDFQKRDKLFCTWVKFDVTNLVQ